jgi:chaperonin GroES
MLNIEAKLKIDESVWAAPNLTDRFSEDDLARLGAWCHAGFERDQGTRINWRARTQAALDLAQQVVKEKTFPWPNASNVAFPLVTIAAMQFHARAYPAIVNGNELVKYKTLKYNSTPEDVEIGRAICEIMNYQLLEEDTSWEEQEDRLLLVTSIVGTTFKKTYHVPENVRNVSELVLPQDLVLDYWAKSVEDCMRKTHVFPVYRNEIYEKVQLGVYRDVLEESWYKSMPEIRQDQNSAHINHREGTTPPLQADETTPFFFHEQHCWVDLDKDGYAEPYIITYESASHSVVRIVARFDRKEDIERKEDGTIIKIAATEYFTKRGFIPSPDGGIMDIGFGMLLGPINESVNTAINQLMDAGTMMTTAGGFLGRGAKIRGGTFTFSPNQWLRVDSTGDDLSKSIVPLPVREPSEVLFKLLGLLIEYANRIAAATETMAGENPGQNTPAGTTQAMIEQGMKIYAAIFKRQWRGLKEEFKKLYKLNAVFLERTRRQYFLGDPSRVAPAADPNIASDQQRYKQALIVKEAAMATPGYDPVAVERFFLKSLKVEDIDSLYTGKMPEPKVDPKVQIEQMKAQVKMQEMQQDHVHFILELQEEARLNSANIVKLVAEAQEAAANAANEPAHAQAAMINAQISVLKTRNEAVMRSLEVALKKYEIDHAPKPTSTAK